MVKMVAKSFTSIPSNLFIKYSDEQRSERDRNNEESIWLPGDYLIDLEILYVMCIHHGHNSVGIVELGIVSCNCHYHRHHRFHQSIEVDCLQIHMDFLDTGCQDMDLCIYCDTLDYNIAVEWLRLDAVAAAAVVVGKVLVVLIVV